MLRHRIGTSPAKPIASPRLKRFELAVAPFVAESISARGAGLAPQVPSQHTERVEFDLR